MSDIKKISLQEAVERLNAQDARIVELTQLEESNGEVRRELDAKLAEMEEDLDRHKRYFDWLHEDPDVTLPADPALQVLHRKTEKLQEQLAKLRKAAKVVIDDLTWASTDEFCYVDKALVDKLAALLGVGE